MNYLLNVVWSWKAYFDEYLQNTEGAEILSKTFGIISTILWVVLGVVGAIGAIYAIWLGVNLARAEDQSKRDDAKKHLITVFIAIGVTIALIVIFNTALPALVSAFSKDTGFGGGEGEETILKPILSLLKA